MNVLNRARSVWQSMVGDTRGRYFELKQRKKLGLLNDFERNELECLQEKHRHFARHRR